VSDWYPLAVKAPWKYLSPDGQACYFQGQCRPEAAVLHIQAGYAHTAIEWAAAGHYGASWHYTVARDGTVFQHLAHEDGGYQAGIPLDYPRPTWKGYRPGPNINCYTIGIEHEGFPGEPFTQAQAESSRTLCKWLAQECGFPYDRDHFPPHADIDLINRPNDFNTPPLREEHYKFMFEEDDDMTPQEREDLKNLVAIMGGSAKLKDNAERGNDFILGYAIEQQKLGEHIADKAAHR
jgi:hypothetical protein